MAKMLFGDIVAAASGALAMLQQWVPIGTALMVTSLVGCSGTEEKTGSSRANASDKTGQLQEGISTERGPQREVLIASQPYAACTLHRTDAAEDAPLRVRADDEGLVHLWAWPGEERYALNCVEAGASVSYALDLADPEALRAVTPRAPSNRKIRPALSDPMSLSHEELLKQGYPPRPDPKDTVGYAAWLKLVSVPVTLIPHASFEEPSIRLDHTNTTSATWNGPALNATGARYVWSAAGMIVPGFTPQAGFTHTEAAFWSGIGRGGPIIQIGVWSQSSTTVTTNQIIWEYLPSPSHTLSFGFSPSDHLTFWAWEGNANGVLTVGGGYGWFWLQNDTRATSIAPFGTPIPSGSQFTGDAADFIMERICTNRSGNNCLSAHPLSKWYGFVAGMTGAAVSGGSWHNWSTDHFDLYQMHAIGSTTLISTSITDDASGQAFYAWLAPQ